jgi:hypothetical protein
MVGRMGETILSLSIIAIVFGVMLVTLYGAALVLSENFWIGVIFLLLLTPLFFIWAFVRGLKGQDD